MRRQNDYAYLRRRRLSAGLAAILFPAGAACIAAFPGHAGAATIVVDSTAEPGTAATCSLRQAVVSINTGAVTGACQNIGGAFGSSDTIRFANALFATGTPAVTLQSTLYVGGLRRPEGNFLHIDAGAGRKVIVQRDAASPDRFSVITAAMGYSNASNTAHGELRLSGLIVRNGIADNDLAFPISDRKYALDAGGGIASMYATLVIDRCEIRGNTATIGGGIYAGSGALVVESSIIEGNAAVGDSEHIFAAAGGGLVTTGRATIRNSTISGNTSTGSAGGAAIASRFGGVSVTNSTISGNASLEDSVVGATITLHKPYQTMLFLNSTIACNEGPSGAGAIAITTPNRTTLTAKSTIFANRTNTRCATSITKEIVAGGTGIQVAGDRNLVVSSAAIDASAPFAVSPLVADPLLGPLQFNGGPTPTHAIDAASPARNAGSDAASLGTDQRGSGHTRVVGGYADVGAFEHQLAGFCGPAHGGAFASLNASSPGLCSASATLQGFFGSGPWSWFCALPSDPGSNEFCGARVLASTSLAILDANSVPTTSAVWGQPLRLRAVVSAPASTPTGGVTFFDVTGGGNVPVCVDTPLAAGIAVCETANVPPIAAGARQLRAVYGGGGSHGPATSPPAAIAISPAASVTTIVAHAPDPVALGGVFTVSAGVMAVQPSVGVPIGRVDVDDETDATSCTFGLGVESNCSLVARSAGSHSLTVSYHGDGNVAASQATTLHQVTPGMTIANASVLPAAITLGESASVTATLVPSVPPDIAVPTGTIAVGGAGAACDVVVPATACGLTPRAAGVQSISADYPGDGNFTGAIATTSLEVARAASSLSIEALPAAAALGEAVEIGVELLTGVAPAIAVPGGSITVAVDGGSEACTIALPATACSWMPPGAGMHAVSAHYGGDANFLPSQSTQAGVEVARGTTAVDIALSPDEITLGEPVTVTAAVTTTVPPAVATPTGSVTVDDGAGADCTITLPAQSCELTPAAAGALTITATYAGDANFEGSSADAALEVAPLPARIVLAIDDGRTHARYGETLVYAITMVNNGEGPTGAITFSGTPSPNFAGAVLAWTCTPANGATCTASGSGTLLTDTVVLPPGASLTWTVDATVPQDAGGDAVAFTADAGGASASDVDTLVVFRDGFE